MKLAVAFVVAVVVASGFAVSASADGPVAGTTFFTQCTFAAGPGDTVGTTQCSRTIVSVSPGICWSAESGFRLWSEVVSASVRSYRGNAVLWGLNGVTVNADYSSVLRPHSAARLIDDSGPHAFSSTFPVADASCP
jgi:hypothetical protein